jgi:hypothetical protein
MGSWSVLRYQRDGSKTPSENKKPSPTRNRESKNKIELEIELLQT